MTPRKPVQDKPEETRSGKGIGAGRAGEEVRAGDRATGPNLAGTPTGLPAMRVEKDSAEFGYGDFALKYDERLSYGFKPLYPDLKQLLLTDEKLPNETIAHVLSTCSAYAYSDCETLKIMMTRMGLENNVCRQIPRHVDAMLIDSTAFLVESDDGEVVILCYRGTRPFSLLNWLISLDVEHNEIPIFVGDSTGKYEIHAGFYRNVRATRHEVEVALSRALRENESVIKDRLTAKKLKSLKALYITGHSLGGAMAALMAFMLVNENRFERIAEKLKAVYTFGQPMIGPPDFAEFCNEHDFLGNKVFRYVYDKDLVPALPPKLSGDFKHFGRELRWDGQEWRNSSGSTTQASDLQALVGFVSLFPYLINQPLCREARRLLGGGRLGFLPIPKISIPDRLGPLPIPKISIPDRLGPLPIPNPFAYAIKDHLPGNYTTALGQGRSEFGDDLVDQPSARSRSGRETG